MRKIKNWFELFPEATISRRFAQKNHADFRRVVLVEVILQLDRLFMKNA